jgi:hypothetical protein
MVAERNTITYTKIEWVAGRNEAIDQGLTSARKGDK